MEKKMISSQYRKEHADWRMLNFQNKCGFFPVFYGFKDYLSELSGGAVALFLYIGLHANNATGECYHDLKRIADYFGKSQRTIGSWFSELERHELIERLQLTYNGAAHTFIRPYGKGDKQDDD